MRPRRGSVRGPRDVNVEVCCAGPDGATRIAVAVPDGAVLGDAVQRSGILEALGPQAGDLAFAIYGLRATPDSPLHEGDRIELLRPLQVDPKEARRRRVAKKEGRRRPDAAADQ